MGTKTVKCLGFGSKKGICENYAQNLKVSPYCKNCAGKAFEAEVAELFRMQGYDVRPNIKISSTQNDIYASIKYGFLETGVLIECKFKFDENDTVKSSDVKKCSSNLEVYNKQRYYGKADKAFLVTNGDFAPEAREVAHQLDVVLFNLNELINKLINFEPYLKKLIQDYENSELFAHYIDLYTTNEDSLLKEEIINFYLNEDRGNAMVVLGDYGTGKTSFCLNLAYELASQKLNGYFVPIPLIIQMRDYSKAFDMEQLITDLLINKLKIPNGNFETFTGFLDYGQFLLIFDGFDEASRRVDYAIKQKIYSEICRFASSNSKVIVTCRKNYFNQKQEFERIFKASPLYLEPNLRTVPFEEIEVKEFNVDQIYEYINSYEQYLIKNGFNVADFIDVVQNTHDLSDLAQRPVLLNIMINTLPELMKDKASHINAAKLYDSYTNIWLQREDTKGKTLIKYNEKMFFTKELAWKMFVTNELSIHFSKLPKEINKHFKQAGTIEDIDHYSHDIQSCSFLNRDDGGNYQFIHKSFMEFFVASRLFSQLYDLTFSTLEIEEIHQRLDNLLGQTLITFEVGLFLKDFIENIKLSNAKFENIFSNFLTSLNLSKLNKNTIKNVICLLGKLDINILPYVEYSNDLSGVDLSFCVLNGGVINNHKFLGTIMVGCKINNVVFKDCIFTDAILRKTSVFKSKFYNCLMDSADLSKATFEECLFNRCDLSYSALNESRFSNCNFGDSEISEINHNKTEFINCSLENTYGTPYTLHLTIK